MSEPFIAITTVVVPRKKFKSDSEHSRIAEAIWESISARTDCEIVSDNSLFTRFQFRMEDEDYDSLRERMIELDRRLRKAGADVSTTYPNWERKTT